MDIVIHTVNHTEYDILDASSLEDLNGLET